MSVSWKLDPALLEAQVSVLAREFPGWHFWTSSEGRVWAQGGSEPGCYRSLDADTPRQMREKLSAAGRP